MSTSNTGGLGGLRTTMFGDCVSFWIWIGADAPWTWIDWVVLFGGWRMTYFWGWLWTWTCAADITMVDGWEFWRWMVAVAFDLESNGIYREMKRERRPQSLTVWSFRWAAAPEPGRRWEWKASLACSRPWWWPWSRCRCRSAPWWKEVVAERSSPWPQPGAASLRESRNRAWKRNAVRASIIR